jgi:hypothetical protein
LIEATNRIRISRSHIPLDSSPAHLPGIWGALVARTRPRPRTWEYALALLMHLKPQLKRCNSRPTGPCALTFRSSAHRCAMRGVRCAVCGVHIICTQVAVLCFVFSGRGGLFSRQLARGCFRAEAEAARFSKQRELTRLRAQPRLARAANGAALP